MDNYNYMQYLKSAEWREKARERLKIDDFRCCMCGCCGTKNNPLEIHHVTYKHIYHEEIYHDLLTLCHCCHTAVHRMMNRRTAPDRFGWKDELKISEIHAVCADVLGA